MGGFATSMARSRVVGRSVIVLEPITADEPVKKSISSPSIRIAPPFVVTPPLKMTWVAPKMVSLPPPVMVSVDLKSTTP